MKVKIFIDMDGTVAEWRVDGYPYLNEKGYFSSLQPLKSIGLLETISHYCDVYILSAVMETNPYAKEEKLAWVKKYMPFIKEDHILFNKNGTSKADFIRKKGMLNSKSILIDDYSVNLDDWSKKGGTAVKFLNGINGKRGRHYKYCLKEDATYFDNLLNICRVLEHVASI